MESVEAIVYWLQYRLCGIVRIVFLFVDGGNLECPITLFCFPIIYLYIYPLFQN